MGARPYPCRHVTFETPHSTPNHFPISPEARGVSLSEGSVRSNGQRICQSERLVRTVEFSSAATSKFSAKVLTNLPVKMPHYGECDVDSETTDEASDFEHLAGGADDPGPGCYADGCQRAPHQAHPGGLLGERRVRPGRRDRLRGQRVNLAAGVGQAVQGAVAQDGVVKESEPLVHGAVAGDDEAGRSVPAKVIEDEQIGGTGRIGGCGLSSCPPGPVPWP